MRRAKTSHVFINAQNNSKASPQPEAFLSGVEILQHCTHNLLNKNIKRGSARLFAQPPIMIADPQKLIKADFIIYSFLIKR